MLKEPFETFGDKRPRAFFRLLALFLFGLAMAEAPFGTARVFAEANNPTRHVWVERPGDLPGHHALPKKAALEAPAGAALHVATSYPPGQLDEPVLAAASSAGAQARRVTTNGSLLDAYLVPVLACLSSARDPPLTA